MVLIQEPSLAKEGFALLAHEAASRKWVLFKLRPKLHMQAHLVNLWLHLEVDLINMVWGCALLYVST